MIERSCELPAEKLVQMFSIVQRGHDYSHAAGNSCGYVTHPVRWQVLGPRKVEPMKSCSSTTLGGFILGAIGEGTLSRDPSAIADALARMRANAAQHPVDLSNAKGESDAREMLLPILRGALPGSLREHSFRWLQAFLAGAATIVVHALDLPVLAHVTYFILLGGSTPHVSRMTACFLRQYTEYPYVLDLPVKGCSACGAPLDNGSCLVCKLRAQEEEQTTCESTQQDRPNGK